MGNKKIIILAALAGVVTILILGCVLGLGWASPKVRVENHSGEVVRDLRLSLFVGDKERTEEIGDLASGDSREVAKRCSDLLVTRMTFRIGERAFAYTEYQLATTGETIVLMIQPDGSVLVAYRNR